MELSKIPSVYAKESPSSLIHYPKVSEDVFQWKSKQKPKKGKSPNEEGKIEAVSEGSTMDGTLDASEGDESTSAVHSQSTNSASSKRGKKRDRHHKKVVSEHSENANADSNVIYESTQEKPKTECKEYSPFVTLSCPVCSDPECVLNVAATCPLLRQNEEEPALCQFCEASCECTECSSVIFPISGLVPRDENGVAETLLKNNGGPIEDSSAWAHRDRWMVPYGINWDEQVHHWITSRMRETSKTTLEGSSRKHAKSRFGKRKSKNTSTPPRTVSQVVTPSDNVAQEVKDDDMKVFLEGNGFKIFVRGQDKVLVNLDTKNCKYLGCSCKPDSAVPNCGCTNWVEENHASKCNKKDKACKVSKHSAKVSLMKETSHGLTELLDKDVAKGEKSNQEAILNDKNERNEHEIDEVKEDKANLPETGQHHAKEKSPEKSENPEGKKVKAVPGDKKGSGNQKGLAGLSAKDVRHSSRADVLEDHLRGNNDKKDPQSNAQVAFLQSEGCPIMYPPTDAETTEVMMEMMGQCMCAERYCYTPA